MRSKKVMLFIGPGGKDALERVANHSQAVLHQFDGSAGLGRLPFHVLLPFAAGGRSGTRLELAFRGVAIAGKREIVAGIMRIGKR